MRCRNHVRQVEHDATTGAVAGKQQLKITHPAISLAAVIGVPHDSHREETRRTSSSSPVSRPRRGDRGMEQAEHGRVQVPTHRADRPRAPDDRHQQDPQVRAELASCAGRTRHPNGAQRVSTTTGWHADTGTGGQRGRRDAGRHHLQAITSSPRPGQDKPRRGASWSGGRGGECLPRGDRSRPAVARTRGVSAGG